MKHDDLEVYSHRSCPFCVTVWDRDVVLQLNDCSSAVGIEADGVVAVGKIDKISIVFRRPFRRSATHHPFAPFCSIRVEYAYYPNVCLHSMCSQNRRKYGLEQPTGDVKNVEIVNVMAAINHLSSVYNITTI